MSKKKRRPSRPRTPTWQPVSAMPLVAATIEQHLSHLTESLETLSRAKARPYVLDDATVRNVTRVHKKSLDNIAIYEGLLEHWRQETLTDAQRLEVERLAGQVHWLRTICREILDLAEALSRGTIETVLGMSDEEAGRAALAGHFGPIGEGNASARGWKPAIVDVTDPVFTRIKQRLTPQDQQHLATASVPYGQGTMLIFLSAMAPSAVEEAVARSAGGGGRGMILADQTGSDWAFRWIPRAICDAALHVAAPEVRREVAEIVEVYDTDVEAVVVMLTRTSVRAMWAHRDGTMRSPGSRPVERAPVLRPEGVESNAGEDPDGGAWYEMTHRELGRLGRLVLRPRDGGEIEARILVAEHPGASVEEDLQRAAIFLPLAAELVAGVRRGMG